MIDFDPSRYAPAVAQLLAAPRLNPLDAGQPEETVRAQLEALADERVLLPVQVRRRDLWAACRAGLFLHFNFLDQSHRISQDLSTAEGSYWHAILHRREPDFSNSKYWFRRVGTHPVYEPLRHEAARLAAAAPAQAAFLTRQTSWDPFAFVDLCEASLEGRCPCKELCQEIQLAEWRLLFDDCYRQAIIGG